MWHGVVERGPVHALLFAPDSRTIFSIDGSKAVSAWDMASQTSSTLFSHTHNDYSSTLHLSLDGNSLLVAEGNPGRGRYLCWDRRLNRLVYPGDTTKDPGGVFWFLSHGVSWPSFSAEGRIYLCDMQASRMSFFNWPPRGEGQDFTLPRGYTRKQIRRMISDQAGTRLAIWFADETLLIWDRFGENAHRKMKFVPSSDVPAMTYSPDGQYLALGTLSGITILDASKAKQIQSIELPGRRVTDLAFHPGNRRLAAADGRAVVTFWDIASGAVVREYGWKIGRVRSLAFAPDGLTCAAGGTQKKFVIWDVE
jgi:WD40 repeat protein